MYTVDNEVLIFSGQTLNDISGRSGTEKTEGTLWSTDKHWRDCTWHRWTQWHRTNRRYNMNNWQALGRHQWTQWQFKNLTVKYELLTDLWRTLQDSKGHSDTEPTNGILWGIDRQWRDCTSHRWSQWHGTNRRYSMKFWQTADRKNTSTVGAVTQKQQIITCGIRTGFGQTV